MQIYELCYNIIKQFKKKVTERMKKLNITDLKNELIKRNISQKDFASMTGIRLPTLNSYCTGTWKTISQEHIKKISKALDKELIIDIADAK